MAVTLLDAVARLRRRIYDTGGDLPAPPSGYSYSWQYDDTTCSLKNPDLVQMLDEAQIEFCRREPSPTSHQPPKVVFTIWQPGWMKGPSGDRRGRGTSGVPRWGRSSESIISVGCKAVLTIR